MKIYILFLTTIIFFTGCSNTLDISPTKVQKSVKNLKPQEMKLVYKTVLDEIKLQKEKGDKAYRNGYNSDAIEAYEMVNYCMGYAYIPINKINNIKHLSKYKSDYHYKEVIKHIKKNKKRALLELNSLLKNNPKHKVGLKYLTQLKKTKEIKKFIKSLEIKLKMALANNNSSIKDIKKINFYQKHLISYDNKNPLIEKAEDVLTIEHDKLIKKLINHYNKGKINLAKKSINNLLSVYKEDTTAKHYLAKIASESDLNKAKIALDEGKCIKAIKILKRILKENSKNTKGKKILSSSKSKCKEQISKIIQEGKKQYYNKNLYLAKKSFQEVLKIDPNNSVSFIYLKKIDSQLKTINSLN